VQKNFEILCKFLGFISRNLRILSSSAISEILSVVIFGFCRGPFGQLRKNIAALNGPKYKARGLDSLLNEYFGSDPYLAGALTSVIIPSFDIKIQQPVFFSSWKAKQEVLDNVPVKLVCGATSAAPTYLPPVQFTLQDTKADPPVTREFNMIDGGVAVNNPAYVGITQAIKEVQSGGTCAERMNYTVCVFFLSFSQRHHHLCYKTLTFSGV
jgi:patatin-like phospholipase/acyl hydrolase